MSATAVYGYRWVVVAAAAPIIMASQVFWLSFAPVATQAQAYFGTSSLGISMLSMSYMLMYVLFTFPASWLIDGFGYRHSLVVGAVLTAVAGALRAAGGNDFTAVLVCQFLIAAGQPFLLNVLTKIPANWFPLRERAVASGMLTLVQYVGMMAPMALSPLLVHSPGDIRRMMFLYAGFAVVGALLAVLFTRERPPLPPGPSVAVENISLKAMAGLFTNAAYVQVLVLMFVSLGVFNTLLTEIDQILTPRGLSIGQADTAGAVFIVAGVVGAVLLPLLSDRIRRRIPLLTVGMVLMTAFYLLLTYARGPLLITAIAALAGLTIMGLAPIVFQHSAETAYPVGEGTSFGLLFLMGQISGALFIYLFEWTSAAAGSVRWPMLMFVVLTALQIPVTLRMRESPLLTASLAPTHA
ncbi:MAG: MFS transporter [Actinomycetia bacterium]|nr:MFS transporter [Actinomycetes bacterium]